MTWVWALVVFGASQSSAAFSGSDRGPRSSRGTLFWRSVSGSGSPSCFSVIGIWPCTTVPGPGAESTQTQPPAAPGRRRMSSVQAAWRSAMSSRPPQAVCSKPGFSVDLPGPHPLGLHWRNVGYERPGVLGLKGVESGPCRRSFVRRRRRQGWPISPARQACAWDRAADMAGDRLHRILAELSAGGTDVWSSARLCRGCVKIVGVDGAGVMLMSGDIPRG